MPHDYDSPWKEAIENLFQDFMTFFFINADWRVFRFWRCSDSSIG